MIALTEIRESRLNFRTGFEPHNTRQVSEDSCAAAAVSCHLGIESVRRVVDIRVDRPFAFVLDHKVAGMLGAGVIKSPEPTR